MITIDSTQLYRKIQLEGFKVAVIYDKMIGTLNINMHYFEKYECTDPDALEQALREFNKIYNGAFTILLKKSTSGGVTNGCVVHINLMPEVAEGVKQVQGTTHESAEDMKKRIMLEIRSEYQLTMLQATIKQQEAQILETSTSAGRLSLIFENFITAKMGGKAALFQKGATLQGTVQVENTDSKVNDEDFGKALIKIKDKFGVSALMKIAEKIEANDPQIDILMNMLK